MFKARSSLESYGLVFKVRSASGPAVFFGGFYGEKSEEMWFVEENSRGLVIFLGWMFLV